MLLLQVFSLLWVQVCCLTQKNKQVPRSIKSSESSSTMKDLRIIFIGLVLVHSIFWQANPVLGSAEDEDNLLQGINSYRQVQKLPPLVKNDKAMCLSDKLADQLEDKPCSSTYGANVLPGTGPQFSDYPKLLSKCDIDVNHTKEGVILPVCVPKLVPTLVLTNYTHTPYAKYLNNSGFTGAGLGSEDNWMVLVLTTNTPGGSFVSGATPALPVVGMLFHLVLSLFMGLIVS